MGCATGLVKAVMFMFNFLFVLAGLALITVGTMFYLQLNAYENVIDSEFQIAPTLLIIVGAIVFVIAFFGCCGVIRESHCMLVTYAVFLLTIFALQLAIGIYAYLQVDKADGDVRPLIEKSMSKGFEQYNENKEIREAFDIIQRELHCCGVSGPLDYQKKFLNTSVPATCCKIYDGTPCSIITGLISASFYSDGCVDKLSYVTVTAIQQLSYVAIGVAAVEIIGAIFALCLASSVKNESRRRYP